MIQTCTREGLSVVILDSKNVADTVTNTINKENRGQPAKLLGRIREIDHQKEDGLTTYSQTYGGGGNTIAGPHLPSNTG